MANHKLGQLSNAQLYGKYNARYNFEPCNFLAFILVKLKSRSSGAACTIKRNHILSSYIASAGRRWRSDVGVISERNNFLSRSTCSVKNIWTFPPWDGNHSIRVKYSGRECASWKIIRTRIRSFSNKFYLRKSSCQIWNFILIYSFLTRTPFVISLNYSIKSDN